MATIAVLVGALAMAGPASAQVEARLVEESSPGQSLMDDDHIIVETFTRAGDLISTEAFGRGDVPMPVPEDFESEGIVIHGASPGGAWLSGSGSGGSSSASGCIKVTVRNKKETLLGFTAY